MTERVESEGEDRFATGGRAGCPALPAESVEAEAEAGLMGRLDEFDRKRLVLLQGLIGTIDHPEYGKRQQAVADQLGITVRTVRRWMRQLREHGIASVVRRSRSDRGANRISDNWRRFIIQTYRDGNRGSRQISPAQVAVRVRARAEELGTEDYPCHATVYRILQLIIEQEQQPKRSLGWRNDCLVLRTRDGLEIAIEWSNQAWQADHTRVDVLVVDQAGTLLGRPWLTIVVDTHSRCIRGIHLGFDAPSAAYLGSVLNALLESKWEVQIRLD